MLTLPYSFPDRTPGTSPVPHGAFLLVLLYPLFLGLEGLYPQPVPCPGNTCWVQTATSAPRLRPQAPSRLGLSSAAPLWPRPWPWRAFVCLPPLWQGAPPLQAGAEFHPVPFAAQRHPHSEGGKWAWGWEWEGRGRLEGGVVHQKDWASGVCRTQLFIPSGSGSWKPMRLSRPGRSLTFVPWPRWLPWPRVCQNIHSNHSKSWWETGMEAGDSVS